MRTPYPNELYHHGIKGQKWGVRRFQNPDGTLTSAGKKRYLTMTGETSYQLTKAGKKAEQKAHDKLYGKGSHKAYGEQLEKDERRVLNDMARNQSSKNLEAISVTTSQAAKQFRDRHINTVSSGSMFTDEYFNTKKASLIMASMANNANKVLAERGRLFSEAKNNNRYSLDYLEYELGPMNSSDRLKDYDQYLNDPSAWREKHGRN